MKTQTEELWVNVPERRAIVSIHRDVERIVRESGVQDGLVLVNAMHITASVFICLLYTSPSPRDQRGSRMPSSA